MLRDNHDLKISLQELRKLIDIDKKDWINIGSTNCYAYALGLDIPEYKIINYAYAPGVLSSSNIFLPNYRLFTYEMLINNIYWDFEALKIDFREIDPLEEVASDEWKIALFITKHYEQLEDYHFLRQHKDGFWYHKRGYRGGISQRDSHGLLIKNPEECYLKYRTYNKCFSLKLKK